MRYFPGPPPRSTDQQSMVKWMADELLKIGKASTEHDEHQMIVRHAEPKKYKPGLIVYADGTDWNPGAGEGVYVRTSGGWTKL